MTRRLGGGSRVVEEGGEAEEAEAARHAARHTRGSLGVTRRHSSWKIWKYLIDMGLNHFVQLLVRWVQLTLHKHQQQWTLQLQCC